MSVNLDLHNLPKLITWLNNEVNLFVFKGSKNIQVVQERVTLFFLDPSI